MVLYQCDKCEFSTKDKGKYSRHCNRKFPCKKKENTNDIESIKEAPGGARRNQFVDNCFNRRSYNRDEFRWGNGHAEIRDFLIKRSQGEDPLTFQRGAAIELGMKVYFHESMVDI